MKQKGFIILFCEPLWILVHSDAFAALIAACFCTSLSLFVRTFICQHLLSSMCTRLCEPLCMGIEVVSLVPKTFSQYQLGLALQVTAQGQEPLALLAHRFGPARSPRHRRAGVCFCCGASRPPTPSVEPRRGLHVCCCRCAVTVSECWPSCYVETTMH